MAENTTSGTPMLPGRNYCAGPQERFRAFAEQNDFKILGTYRGTSNPIEILCPKGHHESILPGRAMAGPHLVCKQCPRTRSARSFRSETKFRDILTEKGAFLLEEKWLGCNKLHRIRCARGHEVKAAPRNVNTGYGFCKRCAGLSTEETRDTYIQQLTEQGAVLLDTWRGVDVRHRVRCSEGHIVSPFPNNVRSGQGICHLCANRLWDVLYVVTDENEENVKFGITSGDPRPRLTVHARDGYVNVVRIYRGLDRPGSTALDLERAIRITLLEAGEEPVRGREYFPIRSLALILDIADNHPAVRPEPRRTTLVPCDEPAGQLSFW